MSRYLFIAANEWPNWAGSELLWSQAAEKLARAGNGVRVSVPLFARPLREVERLKPVSCQIFYRRPPIFFQRLARKLFLLPDDTHSHVRSASKGVDLVVISQGAHYDGLSWMEAAAAAGLRYAVIVQAAAEQWWPSDDIAQRLAACYEAASTSFFVSRANLDLSRRQFAASLSNAKIVRNPFNVPYDACPPWPGNALNELSLACVGRLDANAKGQDLLIQVLGLPHWRARNIRVSFLGKGGNEYTLRRMAEGMHLSNVSFAGYSNDIEGVWSAHQALVLPSRYEGMPLAIVESMLCGRPCIVTDVAGHSELVRDGVNGFLAKAPTVELLDEAMNRAWENRHRLQEMGQTAASDVRKWVSPDPAEDFARELTALAQKARP